MSKVESLIREKLEGKDLDLEGAQDLIDANLDLISGGGHSQHISTTHCFPSDPNCPA